ATALSDTLADHPHQQHSAVIPTLRRDRPDLDMIAHTLAQLHTRGHSPHWRDLYPHAHTVDLPTYPFQHHR
ncbi:hypothetical protein, partial [Mycobacterium szulgai]|uniref:hypothetical protein n=1 Tax=Mycobacterium szulgai TaxID=1787 RepID=UPI0021F3291E